MTLRPHPLGPGTGLDARLSGTAGVVSPMLAGWCAVDSADGLGGLAVLMACASPPEAQLCAAHLGAERPRHPRLQCGLLPSRPRPPPPANPPLTRGRRSRLPSRRGRVSRRLDASGQTCLPACPLPWILWVGAPGWRPACSAGWGSGGGACITPSPSEVLAVVTVGQGKFRPPSLRWLLVWQRGS